ncbi:MAG: TlyA family RNA methyltransferase, partial [Clostridia bacterium]|nr:TlyA family RNA methyltransferase [Clostridia bacterium]
MRADKFFAEKFGSRTKAAQAIESGLVLVNGKQIKPKDEVKGGQEILFLESQFRYVSNGGYKLERAVENFKFACADKVFVDIGASTGGFTDCLLQNGAKKVYAVDVGTSQLCDKIRLDSRVTTMENTNARYLTKADFPDVIDGVVTDVSFISLRLIFPVIEDILSEKGEAIVLIKPQFECENRFIGKSGIVRKDAHSKIVKKVLESAVECGLYPYAIINAPVR